MSIPAMTTPCATKSKRSPNRKSKVPCPISGDDFLNAVLDGLQPRQGTHFVDVRHRVREDGWGGVKQFRNLGLQAFVRLPNLVEGRRGSVCGCLRAIANGLYDKIGSDDNRDKDKEGKPVLFHALIIKLFLYIGALVYTFLANLL